VRAGRLSARSCCAPMQTRPCQFGKKAPALRERTKNQSVLYVRDPLFLCPVPMYNVHTRLFVCMCGMRYRHLIMHPLPRRNNDDDVRTMCENKTFFRLPCHYFTRNAERQRAAAILKHVDYNVVTLAARRDGPRCRVELEHPSAG